MAPVCYVCSVEDASVLPVVVDMVAQRQGLKSVDARSQAVEVQVCGRCWGSALLHKVAGSARAPEPVKP